MTEKKEKTPEEKKKEFDDMQKVQMETLKLNAFLNASNTMKSSYGAKGAEIASNYMKGDQVVQMRRDADSKEAKLAEQLGIAYDVPTTTDYALIKNSKLAVNGALSVLTFGNLEKIANEFNPNLKLKVAEKFKSKTQDDVLKAYEKIKEAKEDVKKLDESSQDLIQYYEILTSAYEQGSVMQLMGVSYLAEVKPSLDKLNEKYFPKTKEAKK